MSFPMSKLWLCGVIHWGAAGECDALGPGLTRLGEDNALVGLDALNAIYVTGAYG
jgi:hypothetical protein